MPQASYVQHGDSVDYKPAVDIASRRLLSLWATSLESPSVTSQANIFGAIAVEGVFDIDKDTAEVFSAGAKVYWDSATNQATTEEAGNKLLGKAVHAAVANNNKVRVRLSQ